MPGSLFKPPKTMPKDTSKVGRASPSAPSEPAAEPTPVNRAVTRDMVRVRANEPIGEEIDGDMCRFAKGEEFALPAARAAVLGPLITRL